MRQRLVPMSGLIRGALPTLSGRQQPGKSGVSTETGEAPAVQG
jgi:hypothetical protein